MTEIERKKARIKDSIRRGANAQVTAQMVEAGFEVLAASGIADDYLEGDRLLVEDIFRAMIALSPGFSDRPPTEG